MRKGATVRTFVLWTAVVLLVTGQWVVLLVGAVSYHAARAAVAAVERRALGTGAPVPDATVA